jgi:hypothetical protein
VQHLLFSSRSALKCPRSWLSKACCRPGRSHGCFRPGAETTIPYDGALQQSHLVSSTKNTRFTLEKVTKTVGTRVLWFIKSNGRIRGDSLRFQQTTPCSFLSHTNSVYGSIVTKCTPVELAAPSCPGVRPAMQRSSMHETESINILHTSQTECNR